MLQNQLILYTAVILFAFFLLGWIASWLFFRMLRPTRSSMSELDRMAQELHDAEEDRDRAVSALEETEARLRSKLSAVEADERVAMEALRESRAEVEELREYIERKLARSR